MATAYEILTAGLPKTNTTAPGIARPGMSPGLPTPFRSPSRSSAYEMMTAPITKSSTFNFQTTPPPPPRPVESSPNNPLAYGLGMVKNAFMDIPEIVGGLTNLVGAVSGDIMKGIFAAVPGTQGIDKTREIEGYKTAMFARALTGIGTEGGVMQGGLAQDIKSRYGFWRGWEGLAEMKDQMYHNPLSYILDFLAVGKGLEIGAKFGQAAGLAREGTQAGAWAAKILGGTAEDLAMMAGQTKGGFGAAFKGLHPFEQTVRDLRIAGEEAGHYNLPISQNPAARVLMNPFINRVFTRTADDAFKMLEASKLTGDYKWLGFKPGAAPSSLHLQTIEKALNEVIAHNENVARWGEEIRIVKPILGSSTLNPFGPVHAARKLFGVNEQNFYDSRSKMFTDLKGTLIRGFEEAKKQGWTSEPKFRETITHISQMTNLQRSKLTEALNRIRDEGGEYKGLTLEDFDNALESAMKGEYVPIGGLPDAEYIPMADAMEYAMQHITDGDAAPALKTVLADPAQHPGTPWAVSQWDPPERAGTSGEEMVQLGTQPSATRAAMGDPDLYETLGRAFDISKDNWEDFGHVQWSHPFSDPATVTDRVARNRSMEYFKVTPDGAPRSHIIEIVRQTEEATGGKLVQLIEGTGADTGHLLPHYGDLAIFELPDGRKFSLFMGDRKTMNGARIWGDFYDDLTKILPGLRKAQMELDEMLKNPGVMQAAPAAREVNKLKRKIENIEEEIAVSQRRVAEGWRGALRDHANPDGYDAVLSTIDDLTHWRHQWTGKKFTKNYLSDHPTWWDEWDEELNGWQRGPHTEQMYRALKPLNVEAVMSDLAIFGQVAEDILHRAKGNRDLADAELLSVIEDLWDFTVYGPDGMEIHPLSDSILADYFKVSNRVYRDDKGVLRPVMNKMGGKYETTRQLGRSEGGRLFSRGQRQYRTTAREIAGQRSGMLPKEITDLEEAARDLTYRVMATIYKHAVNGRIPRYNWRNIVDFLPQDPVYFPHTMSKGSILNDTKLWAAKIAPDDLKRLQEYTPGEFKAMTGKAWLEGTVNLDPQEAYGRAASNLLRHEELMDAMDKLKKFARPADQSELKMLEQGVLPPNHGEVLWAPRAIRRKLSQNSTFMDLRQAILMEEDMGFVEATKKALEIMAEEFKDGAHKTMLDEVYFLPKHIADRATKTVLANFAPGPMRVFWDGSRNLWRASVLSMNPRWILMNEMGNIVFTAIKDPAALRRIFKNYDKQQEWFIHEVMRLTVPEGGVPVGNTIGRGFYGVESADIRKFAGKGGSERWGVGAEDFPRLTEKLDQIYNAKPSRGVSRYAQWIRETGTKMEVRARSGVALTQYQELTTQTWLGKWRDSNYKIAQEIARNGVDQHTLDRMLRGVNAVLGDYTTLSAVERDVVRRFLVPFYPFYRHITKFALKMPFQHPLKAEVFRQLQVMDQQMEDYLPEFLNDSVRVGELGGKSLFFNTANFNPVNMIEQFREQWLPWDISDPWVKSGIQWAFGLNDFGEPWDPRDIDNNIYEAGNGMMFRRQGNKWVPYEGVPRDDIWKVVAGNFGTPMQFFNLHHHKNPTWLTKLAGIGGVSLSRYDEQKYRANVLSGMQQALKYGGQQ